jgi:hypothetical protein
MGFAATGLLWLLRTRINFGSRNCLFSLFN